MKPHYALAEIAQLIGAQVQGDASKQIDGVASLISATPSKLCFIMAPKYLALLADTKAGAVVISPELAAQCSISALVVKNPHLAFTRAAKLFVKENSIPLGMHKSVIVGDNCHIPNTVRIAAGVVLGNNVQLGEQVIIGANSVIGDDCQIGANTELKANVTIYHNVSMGRDCLIQSGTVIGSDGFGNVKDGVHWISVPQLGTVRIGNNVEIGANSTIDRGALDDTIIADGVRLDNLVQVAHNVQLGENTAMAAQSGVAGSAIVGKNCLVSGNVTINGHITVCDNVVFTGRAMVTNSIDEPGVYSSGTGIFKNLEWRKMVARLRHLDKLARTVSKLEKDSQ
ncbi:MAG: UDP-3-O-(3-hydroxymyristoyl)glucosamine N-acyltransferase [Gammaproteobacteria bacterium]|nr:UDP-3-O-(3-hydroxymyristoyl)glucosamine N-acyltransferase [Gammaproteobacteria bacterium]